MALINSGTLNYDLDIVQISSMEPLVAEKSYNKILISGLIAIILVVLFLSVKYKVGGIVASLVLLLDLFLTLTLFVTMKGVVNQQSIAALIVAMGIAVDAIVVLLERTNNELYNDKNLQRAFAKGYKKSISSIVDANIIILVMSIVVFFLGTSASSFALMLSLSSVCSLITMTLCLNLFLSYVAKIVTKPTLFGAKSIYLENKEEYINHKNNASNPLKNTKKYFTGVGVFSIVAIIVMLVFQLAIGEMFNYNRTISNNSSITIVSHKDYFKDNDHIMSFFGEEDLSIELTGISTSEFKEDGVTKYKVTVYTDDSITDKENDITNKVIKNFDKNEEYVENYELYINSINSKSTSVSLLTALYTVGVGLLIVGVYLALRYRYTYALAAIASSIASIILVALFFGFTRIKIGSDIVTSIFAIAVFGLNTLIVSFSRLREMIGNNGKKYISNEERFEAVRKSVIATLPRTLITTLIVTIISVVLLSFSSLNNYSFYVALIVGLIISAVNAIFVSNHVWLFFEKLSDKKKRTFKPKKKNTKFKELEEQVFVGIND